MHALIRPLAVLILLTLTVIVPIGQRIEAQEEICAPLAVQVGLSVGRNCSGVTAQQACYGFESVTSIPFDTTSDQVLTEAGDFVSLVDTQFIETGEANLADDVWGAAPLMVQGDIPTASAGRGLVVIPLGGVMVGNAVQPDEAFVYPKTPLDVTTSGRTTLYTRPDAGSDIAGTVESGTSLQADGVSADGNWLRVVFNSEGRYGTRPFAWVSSASLEEADVSDLNVHEAENLTPMQDFAFKSTAEENACLPTPSAMIVAQSPDQTETRFKINGADILIASTVVFTIREPNIMELRVLKGTAAVCVDTPNEFAVPEGFAVELPLDFTTLIGDETFATSDLCAWTNLRLMSEDEINFFAILEGLQDNILNVPIELPRIVCPSGVGQPICSVFIQDLEQLEQVRRMCADEIISPSICERISGL